MAAHQPITWIMVADGAKARLFAYEKIGGPLRPIRWMEHPDSRLPGHAIASDAKGRFPDRGPGGRSAPEPPTDIRDFEKQPSPGKSAKSSMQRAGASVSNGSCSSRCRSRRASCARRLRPKPASASSRKSTRT
jgi:hypothetical protein